VVELITIIKDTIYRTPAIKIKPGASRKYIMVREIVILGERDG
jgi:hypothetical protein